MIAPTLNRFSSICFIPQKLLLTNTFKFVKLKTSPYLIYKNLNQPKLIFSNRYYISQNQPNLNSFPKSLSHNAESNLKSQNQKSPLKPNASIPQTVLSRAFNFLKNYIKNKIYNTYKSLVRGVAKIFKAAAFLVFLVGMGYVGLFFLMMALYLALAFIIIFRQAFDKRQLSKNKYSSLYHEQKSTINKLIKIDGLIPTVERAENAVLDKIREFHNSRVKILLRTSGLVIGIEIMKKVKSKKGQMNGARLYPFYLRKRMFL